MDPPTACGQDGKRLFLRRAQLFYIHFVLRIHSSCPPQELPLEYNTWLLFRQAVDIILIK